MKKMPALALGLVLSAARMIVALLLFVALVSVPRATWAQGEPLGPEFRVNTYTTNHQSHAAVASDTSGNFVVVWDSLGQDGSSYGIFGQRYGRIVPVELMHFRVE